MKSFLFSAGFLSLVATVVAISQAKDADIDLKSTSTDAYTRAEQTLNGLFHYYWRNDPLRKHIQFFFSCGQIGGGGTQSDGTCSCNDPRVCLYCYRWWDALALESVANHGIYTKTKNHSEIASVIFAHAPYNANWNATATCTFVDDFTWYGIAYLRVYEWLKNPIWLNRSVALLDWAFTYGWDEPCGGFWWSTCDYGLYKDSITMLEVLHLSSKLSYMFPNNSVYLERAEKIWNWIFSFDDGHGLMTESYLVSTGAVPEMCCNNTVTDTYNKCQNTRIAGTSYNQGVLMSASAYLYRRTGDQTYLKVGLCALDAIFANYTTKEGIIIDEPRGYQTYTGQCWSEGDPGGDWYSFNGVFMLHLSYFTELLYENGSLPNATLDRIMTLIEKSSDSAWSKSAVWPSSFGKIGDACNLGGPKMNPNITYPKFHWWWSQNVLEQITPPDPKHFFHKTSLRCYTIGANDTQLWEGHAGSELQCTLKCREDPQCSKYLYAANGVEGTTDCWIWSYNRSDHACNQSDAEWSVGVKRPIGSASCADRCGSREPQKLELGGVCYCDSSCAENLDCCIDYADYCLSDEINTCKGMCKEVEALPVPGGGYCWCFDTDIYNADSWCPDFPMQCLGVKTPTCLDARSQGSALNLFLAHLKLTEIYSKMSV